MLLKKKVLVDRLAKKGYTKKDAGIILDDVAMVIAESLVNGDDVCLHGFGTFSTRTTVAHETRAIHTGEMMHIPAIKTVKFVPGKFLKRSVREGRIAEEDMEDMD